MNSGTGSALSFFLPHKEIVDLEPLGAGNVNDTWLVSTAPAGTFVLQRLNPHVFPDPGLVQDNLALLTHHLRDRLQHIKTGFIPLQLFRSSDGDSSYIAPDGAWWRLLSYIKQSQTVDSISSAGQAREIGRTLGLFHTLCSSLDPSALADPLPGFHNTPLYLEQYDALADQVDEVDDCRDSITTRRQDVFLLEDARSQGLLRQQTIHGDPKAANFLFAADSSRVISLIDLDTVKPGLLLHDIGDCLRSCCNRGGEEKQADVRFDQELFTSLLQGYFSSAADLVTEVDKRLIVDAARLISFELGLRFYTDYLAGNRYFKVNHPAQNLFRAQVQFALVQSIEDQYTELNQISAAVANGAAPA